MWEMLSSEKRYQQDPEWLKSLAAFLDKNNCKEKFEAVKTIFYETYLEYVEEGMKPEIARQKAKSVALHFLIVHKLTFQELEK